MHVRGIPQDWKTESMMRWHEKDIQYMLDGAEMLLMKGAKRLELQVSTMRKPRSVGIIPTSPTIYEARAAWQQGIQGACHL